MVSLGVGLQDQFVGRFMRSGMFDAVTVLRRRIARASLAGGTHGRRRFGGRAVAAVHPARRRTPDKPRPRLDEQAAGRSPRSHTSKSVPKSLRLPM